MGLFSRGNDTRRTASDIRAGQQAARRQDANQSTRPNTVTVAELKKQRSK